MSVSAMFALSGTLSAIASAIVVIWAAFKVNTARIWREEAEAQKIRADRLQTDLTEIKNRLSRIEAENARLIQILTSLDPNSLSVRLAQTRLDGD
ncbi:hypothetical protein [Streptomyces wuyuanensis]|uniref:hypothetical protein n=1 Tax=Streptomyces wuyuanensis TaxID=1196353 RepID=UPI0034417918